MCLYTYSLFFKGGSCTPQGLDRVGVLRDHFSLSQYPSDALPISGLSNGDLVLKGINADDDGLYQCTVANHVGYSVCVVEVKVSGRYRSPKNPLAWGWVGVGRGPGASAGCFSTAVRQGPCLEQLEATYRFI